MELFATFGLQVFIALGIYTILYEVYFRLAVLPEEAYFKSVLLFQIFWNPLKLIVIIGPSLILLINYKTLSWSNFEHGNTVKYFVLFISLILVWTYSTYDFNLYYNQPHYIARLLLIFLAFLVLLNPVFISTLVVLAIVIVKQFHYPLGNYSWTDKRVLFDVLILFNAILYLKLFSQRVVPVFLFVMLCLHGANYVVPAIEKLRIRWQFEEKLHYLVASSYVNGWLSFYDESFILKIITYEKTFNIALITFTLVVEFAPLLMFVHKDAPILILLGAILLHIGIFIFSGIFFWKWILLDVALIVFVILVQFDFSWLFMWPYLVISLFIITFSPPLFRTVPLGWYDTPLTEIYELEAVGISGTIYRVPRYFMSPYDIIFAQNRFFYLNDDKVLVGVYGSTHNPEIKKGIEETNKPIELNTLAEVTGKNYYDRGKAERFDYFIRNYFGNLNKRKKKWILINKLSAPHHIWNSVQGNIYQQQELVKEIRVRFQRVYFDGQTFQLAKSKIIRIIDNIPL